MLCGILQQSVYKGYGLLLTASDSTCEVNVKEAAGMLWGTSPAGRGKLWPQPQQISHDP